jgi:hypothetical protein
MRKMNALICLGCLAMTAVGCKPEEERAREIEAAAAVVPPQEPQMQDQIAKTGVGVKGNSLDGIQGNDARMLMAGPVKAYFNTREKIIFDIALPKSAQLFNALNDRNPKTHEEYMREVVDSAQIKLPELPAGMVYRYRPDVNELWVEAEKKKD